MKNVLAIVGLLLGGCAAGRLLGVNPSRAAHMGIAAVFAFTAMGHFVKLEEMTAMLPATMPARRAIVIASGLLEFAFAAGILLPTLVRPTGIAICCFLVLATPVNVYSALKRVGFGGHATGPRYLLVRMPLQLVLLTWTFWFAVRSG